jgi:putative intracellular protease/amidase
MRLADKGVVIDIAHLGGQPPIDKDDASFATEDTKTFDKDTALQAKLSKTHKLTDVKESDYDAVFYPGVHGPLGLASSEDSSNLITSFIITNQ